MPDFTIENTCNTPVCGLDEAGRGPLAGPVVGACVYIAPEKRGLDFIPAIRDSKTLSDKKLNELYDLITAHFVWGAGECSPTEIDEINILQASFRAMERAFLMAAAAAPPPFPKSVTALIDGHLIPKSFPCPARAIKKGDSLSVSIAAASIIAKVTRDRIMAQLAAAHPQYGWDRNVGYPTAEHIAAIHAHGVTPHHRKTFGPVRDYLARNIKAAA